MRLIHEQHPHRRIELVICIIDGCSAGCDAGNHKVGIGNGHHDVELCVGDRGAKVSDISLLRRERELEKKITTHVGCYIVSSWPVLGWSAKEIDSRQKWYINVSIEHLFPSCSASLITRCHQIIIPKTSFEIHEATCAETILIM